MSRELMLSQVNLVATAIDAMTRIIGLLQACMKMHFYVNNIKQVAQTTESSGGQSV